MQWHKAIIHLALVEWLYGTLNFGRNIAFRAKNAQKGVCFDGWS